MWSNHPLPRGAPWLAFTPLCKFCTSPHWANLISTQWNHRRGVPLVETWHLKSNAIDNFMIQGTISSLWWVTTQPSRPFKDTSHSLVWGNEIQSRSHNHIFSSLTRVWPWCMSSCFPWSPGRYMINFDPLLQILHWPSLSKFQALKIA